MIYTERLEACRASSAELGVPFVREQHGSGPMHYAADIDGLVLEQYPGTVGQTAGPGRSPADTTSPLISA